MTVPQPVARPARSSARAPWAAAPPLLLGLLALALTLAYYGAAYHTQVRADDRTLGLFSGFQSLEGGQTPYRWTKGAGTVCLPAVGASRPRSMLQIKLLGSAVAGVGRADLRLDELSLPLQVAPESRRYRLLIPPSPRAGPICLTLLSDTADPQGSGRAVGVGLRALDLWKLDRSPAPPYGQLAVDIWLAVGGYWLLLRLDLPRPLALVLVMAPLATVGAGLLSGALRFAPDLPFWSAFAAGATALLLGATLAYQLGAPRLSRGQREIFGVALVAALLGVGWAALASLPGTFWPFPLMARAGTAFGRAAALPSALLVIFAALVLAWLRRDVPPPAALAVGAAWLAATGLPVALKASLRGWDTLFQTFLQEGDYSQDLPRIGADPLGFLRGYVASMPDLSLHGKTHPPGNALFLWAVGRAFGPGPVPATWAVIALAALGVWPTYLLARRLAGWRAGLLAAAIYALLPTYMIYAAASMDALLATVLACAICALYNAFVPSIADAEAKAQLSPQHQRYSAIAAGLWLALGLLLSFTTLMLAFVALALAAWRLRSGPLRRTDLLRWAGAAVAVAGTVLLALGAIWLASGYNSVTAFFVGMANNRIDVGKRISPIGLSSYLLFLAVNAVAYGCFLGPWPLHRLISGARRQVGQIAAGSARPADALWAGMAALLGGMLLSGLFYREVERIWLFGNILVAAALADGIMQERDRRSQLALSGLMILGLFIHSLIFRAVLRVSW